MATNSQELARAEAKALNFNEPVGSLSNFNALLLSPIMQKRLDEILQDKKKREQFNNIVVNLVSSNTNLTKCTAPSIIFACLRAFELNLNTNPALGEVWFIQYGDKVQFQLGYKGFYQLMMRSGQYSDVNVVAVREGEYLGRCSHTGRHLFNFLPPRENSNSAIIGYAGFLVGKDNNVQNTYWTLEELEAHGKRYSKSYNIISGLWKINPVAMYEKTIIKQLCDKKAVKSIDFISAIQSDQAVMTDYNEYDYVDNPRAKKLEAVDVQSLEVAFESLNDGSTAVDEFFNTDIPSALVD